MLSSPRTVCAPKESKPPGNQDHLPPPRAAADDAHEPPWCPNWTEPAARNPLESDGLTRGELAKRLGATTPTIVNTARRMETAGLLTRRRDPNDAHLVRLYLTTEAQAAREPVEQARSQLASHATATLTQHERRHLESALRKIIRQMGEEA